MNMGFDFHLLDLSTWVRYEIKIMLQRVAFISYILQN